MGNCVVAETTKNSSNGIQREEREKAPKTVQISDDVTHIIDLNSLPTNSEDVNVSDNIIESLYDQLKRFENIPITNYQGFVTEGIVTRVIDGDTVEILFFNSSKVPTKLIARIYGVDTYESRPSKKIPEEERIRIKQLAKEGKQFTENFVKDKLLKIRFINEKEKFGRSLVEIRTIDQKDLSLSDQLISHKLAVAYFGGKKTLPS